MDSFVDSLHGNDATFEVLVNQARILNLKQDITAGPNQALIAVGDPTILDFTVVNSPPTPDHRPGNRRDRPGDHDRAE